MSLSCLTLSICSFISSALAEDTFATQADRPFCFTTVEYPPFVICDENNMAIEGLDVRISNEAMVKANLELEIDCTRKRHLNGPLFTTLVLF